MMLEGLMAGDPRLAVAVNRARWAIRSVPHFWTWHLLATASLAKQRDMFEVQR